MVAANLRAWNRGVRLDMPLAEAKSLCLAGNEHSATNGFYFEEHQAERDAQAIQKLAASCECFSPLVGLEQQLPVEKLPESFGSPQYCPPLGCSAILLDVTGTSTLFGGEASLIRQVTQHFTEYYCHAAIGPTCLLAAAAARFTSELNHIASATNAEHAATQSAAVTDTAVTDTAVTDTTITDASQHCPPLLLQAAAGGIQLRCPAEFFYRLPLPALQLPADVIDMMNQLGIENITQLLGLPRAALRARFADYPTRQLDLATGTIGDVIQALPRSREWVVETNLEYPLSDCETIEVLLQRLVQQLCQQISGHRRGALSWKFRLLPPHHCGLAEHGGSAEQGAPSCQPLEFQVDLFQPADSVEQIMQLARLQLQRIHYRFQHALAAKPPTPTHSHQPLSPATTSPLASRTSGSQPAIPKHETPENTPISTGRVQRKRTRILDDFCFQSFVVEITHSVRLVQRQLSLFDDDSQDKGDQQTDQLAHLLNNLSNQLGNAQVVRAHIRPDAAPEYSTRYTPCLGGAAHLAATSKQQNLVREATKKRGRAKNHFQTLERPLYLLTEPELITPLASPKPHRRPGVHRSNDCPDRFSCQDDHWQLNRKWGPERIETRWWNAPTTRRNYWRIELVDGRWLWIFLDLSTLRWYWHGGF